MTISTRWQAIQLLIEFKLPPDEVGRTAEAQARQYCGEGPVEPLLQWPIFTRKLTHKENGRPLLVSEVFLFAEARVRAGDALLTDFARIEDSPHHVVCVTDASRISMNHVVSRS
jgi:hypothetical protein